MGLKNCAGFSNHTYRLIFFLIDSITATGWSRVASICNRPLVVMRSTVLSLVIFALGVAPISPSTRLKFSFLWLLEIAARCRKAAL